MEEWLGPDTASNFSKRIRDFMTSIGLPDFWEKNVFAVSTSLGLAGASHISLSKSLASELYGIKTYGTM
jgi:hypothetical protein